MASADDARKYALVDALRAALGDGQVSSCLDEGDADPRTSRHISGRSIGRPCCWARPETTAHVADIVRLARAHAISVCPVGEATTFWDGLRVGGAVALDVTTLRAPLAVDPARRLAWAGAGCSVRAVDRAARAHGLCLAAHPDTSGDTPIGSLVAVGSTAGLGLGLVLPIEQVTGATIVIGTGEIVRTGAGHALGGAPVLRHGLPDLLGLLTAAEGQAAVLTEVGLALRPAPFIVRGRGRRSLSHLPPVELLLELLAAARRGLDRGTLATFRIELLAQGDDSAAALEVFFECASMRGADDARAEAAFLRDAIEPVLAAPVGIEIEGDLARTGELPGYDARFEIPPGEHRRRIEGGAFWGAEVGTSWGDELRQCLGLLLALHGELGAAAPHHRRMGVYPSSHAVSAGVQVLGRSEPARVVQVAEILERAVQKLLAAGGVPYRTGNLWKDAVAARLRAVSRDEAADPTEVVGRCLRALDPEGVLPGPRGGLSDRAGGGSSVHTMDSEGLAARRRARIRRALCATHGELVELGPGGDLALPVPGARVVLNLVLADAPGAQVKGRNLSLAYRVEGVLETKDEEEVRARVRAVAETFLRVEAPSPDDEDAADPSLLIDAVDRLRRAELDGAICVTLAGLPPCLDTAIRPEPPPLPVARLHTPLVAPCDACGEAMYCPANTAPRSAPARPLRILCHHDATAAALTAVHAVAGAWNKAVPATVLDTLLSLLSTRQGVLGVPQVPLELSLKRSATLLLPRLRVVEYSPRSRPGLPPREERASRRRDLIELAEACGSPEARGWVAALESNQPPGMELSFGIDADLDEGLLRPQLYAHVEPRDRPRMLAVLRAVLGWSGAQSSAIAKAEALANGDGTPRSDVVLVALSPGPGAPRRTKVYFERRLTDGHASGLSPAEPGALAPFAPERGLAVLACDSGRLRWEKWDFPCATHYQRSGGLAAAFAAGLDPVECARVEQLLDGRRFAPWPTWLSVSPLGSTLYFIPR